MAISNIIITNRLKEELASFLRNSSYSKICVITDEHTQKHCYPLIKDVVAGKGILIQIPSGEEVKTLESCQKIWSFLTTAQFDRKALVINLGGGVIGDMGGFCASTYKRGIDFIQIPTTLLSQADASVGGKLGIDFTDEKGNVFKNHIGVFNNPKAVFVDTTFLATLDPRELRSGFAEVIKHCLIADKQKWEVITSVSFQEQDWTSLASHSVAIKSYVTETDPQEKGLRKILNFGHTLGHAIESFYLNTNKKLLHGEAIAIGMICESFISAKRGFITMENLQRISSYIVSIYGKPEIAVGVEEMRESIEYYNAFTDYFYNAIR